MSEATSTTPCAIDQARAAKQAAAIDAQMLRDLTRGRALKPASFARLKADGHVSGTVNAPTLTGKGRMLIRAHARPAALAGGGTPSSSGPSTTGQLPEHPGLPEALVRLAHPRKGEAALLEACDVAAAARFQRDVLKAGMRQRITQSWSLSSLSHSGVRGSGNASRHEPNAMLDARERMNRVCKAIGPDFSGLLIDICLFEKPLRTIELERRWPARSAKLAVALGLRALARQYGLVQAQTG